MYLDFHGFHSVQSHLHMSMSGCLTRFIMIQSCNKNLQLLCFSHGSCLCRLSGAPAMPSPKAITFTHLKGTPTSPHLFQTSYPRLSRHNPSALSPIGLDCRPLWHNLRHNLIRQKPTTVLPVNTLTGLPPAPPRLAPTPGLPLLTLPSIKTPPSLRLCLPWALPCNSPLQAIRLSFQLSCTVMQLCIRHTLQVKVIAKLRALRCTSPRATACISRVGLNTPSTRAKQSFLKQTVRLHPCSKQSCLLKAIHARQGALWCLNWHMEPLKPLKLRLSKQLSGESSISHLARLLCSRTTGILTLCNELYSCNQSGALLVRQSFPGQENRQPSTSSCIG